MGTSPSNADKMLAAYEKLSNRELLDKLKMQHLQHAAQMEALIHSVRRLFTSADIISSIDAVLYRRFSGNDGQ